MFSIIDCDHKCKLHVVYAQTSIRDFPKKICRYNCSIFHRYGPYLVYSLIAFIKNLYLTFGKVFPWLFVLHYLHTSAWARFLVTSNTIQNLVWIFILIGSRVSSWTAGVPPGTGVPTGTRIPPRSRVPPSNHSDSDSRSTPGRRRSACGWDGKGVTGRP